MAGSGEMPARRGAGSTDTSAPAARAELQQGPARQPLAVEFHAQHGDEGWHDHPYLARRGRRFRKSRIAVANSPMATAVASRPQPS